MGQQIWSATELSKRIKRGEVTVMDAVELVYEAIEKTEREYHCYITIREKQEVKHF